MFSIPEIIGFIVGALGVLLTIMNIIDKQSILKAKAEEPFIKLEGRVDTLEHWQKNVDLRLEEGTRHFNRIDDGTKIVQQSLLALMDNALSEDGKRDELQKARDNLFTYLSGK